MNCPACGYGLEPQRLDQVAFHRCPLCQGLLVETLKSLQLFRALENAGIEEPTVADGAPEEAGPCPKCAGATETFAYMGGDPDLFRCSPCRLLFVPGARQLDARNAWRRQQGRHEKKLARKAKELHREMIETPIVSGTRSRAARAGVRARAYSLQAWDTMSRRFSRDDDD